ncbi:MAG: hypothetical protein KTR26_21085, partial [Flammeovirgaceae bacterium]|nr:hypothetical protein [Flammeovirgaceae bacterium]
NPYFCLFMKSKNLISPACVVFSRWTRKSYAVFASLNKVINISRLAVEICVTSFCKIPSVLRFTNQETQKEGDFTALDLDEESSAFSLWLIELFVSAGLIKIDFSFSGNVINIIFIQSPYFAVCNIWALLFFIENGK